MAASILPDRSRFLRDIDARIEHASEAAIVVIDAATPNQIAEIVLALGEPSAESFDRTSAERIAALLPAGTALYALSAARFGCILGHADEKSLDALADGLLHPIAGLAVPAATSPAIGIAHHPRDGATADELVRAATQAAHESLRSARPWCRYSPAGAKASLRSASLLRDIGAALASEDQLHLAYQPKTDLRTGRCVGAEALVRWHHPAFGPVPPGEFVPIVEETSLVHAMTDWVLGAALHQIADWRAAGLTLQIAVNVSMADLMDERFSTRLAALLEHHEVRPDWIDIEVTESAVARNMARAGRQLDAIRRLGVALVIDDFGSGHAALSYLKHIPASQVKIDQLFVTRLLADRSDRIMVRSTIELVHALGRRVVAEGIEDGATLDWLRTQGCDIGQGNAISLPLEARSFEAWVSSRT
jgi:EAL domain-containing protein (putative c-di-GMP-specific phosphodiesterase class I)/GGDEF domain-containing protein